MDNKAEIAELESLYQTYIDAWNRIDLDIYCSLFAFPIAIGGGGRAPDVVSDIDAWRLRTASNLDALAKRGWFTSVIDALHVGLMAGDTGFITVVYTRLAADGSQIESGTSNYLTRKIAGEWKMVGMLSP